MEVSSQCSDTIKTGFSMLAQLKTSVCLHPKALFWERVRVVSTAQRSFTRFDAHSQTEFGNEGLTRDSQARNILY